MCVVGCIYSFLYIDNVYLNAGFNNKINIKMYRWRDELDEVLRKLGFMYFVGRDISRLVIL